MRKTHLDSEHGLIKTPGYTFVQLVGPAVQHPECHTVRQVADLNCSSQLNLLNFVRINKPHPSIS